MLLSRFSLALAALLAVAGCDASGPDAPLDPTPITLSPLAKTLVGQSNAFGTDLFAEVASGEDGNVMLSPLSASIALTMLLNGADGETYDQIHEMLGYTPDQDLAAINAGYQSLREQLLAADPEVQFTLANAVFHNTDFSTGTPFHPAFLGAMRDGFDAEIEGLSFATPEALDTINGWASDNTNGRVPQVLAELDPALVLLLMNALYFKGDWTTPFDADLTSDADFTLASGETVEVPTMRGQTPARLASGDGYRALELPYGRRNFSMVVLMPDEAPLADFAAQLDAGLWSDATTRLDALDAWGDVTVGLPRFSFSNDMHLNDALRDMGMVTAFTPEADLSRMSDARLMVSFVKQNTFVEVNEEGTEAAAVTTIGVEVTSLGPEFFADRPFVFAIRERTTNTLLFIGQVADPRS